MFVTKFNAQGNDLVYSTYLGGTGSASGIAVDQNANAYITGVSDGVFPTTANAYQPDWGGGWDAVVAKFNADGSNLIYSTFLGGAGDEGGRSIAVDNSGNAYVTGRTTITDSSNFPTTPGVTQPNPIGSLYSADAFVSKLNADGSALVYSTFLGGTNIYGAGNSSGASIAVDAVGNAYVTGSTDATSNFPTKNPIQASLTVGHYDAFVTKIDAVTGALVFSTYLGGTGLEQSKGITTDRLGNTYVTGNTQSTNFPTRNPYQANSGGGGQDAFVTKIGNPPGVDNLMLLLLSD